MCCYVIQNYCQRRPENSFCLCRYYFFWILHLLLCQHIVNIFTGPFDQQDGYWVYPCEYRHFQLCLRVTEPSGAYRLNWPLLGTLGGEKVRGTVTREMGGSVPIGRKWV